MKWSALGWLKDKRILIKFNTQKNRLKEIVFFKCITKNKLKVKSYISEASKIKAFAPMINYREKNVLQRE